MNSVGDGENLFPKQLWRSWHSREADQHLKAFASEAGLEYYLEVVLAEYHELTRLFLRCARVRYGERLHPSIKRSVQLTTAIEVARLQRSLRGRISAFDHATADVSVSAPRLFWLTGSRLRMALRSMRRLTEYLAVAQGGIESLWLRLVDAGYSKTQKAMHDLARQVGDVESESRCLQLTCQRISKLVLSDLGLARRLGLGA